MTSETKTKFTPADWTEEDTRRADRIWEEYQQTHDVSDRTGQAVGIDPKTAEVWFGESALDIAAQRRERGLYSPLLFLRVGHPAYLYKGGHR